VPCEGAGQQRYKFQRDKHSSALQSQKPAQGREVIVVSYEGQRLLTPILGVPENDLYLLVDAFVDKIAPSTGINFNLAWSYGGYLEDVPRRLGTNTALDAAAEALVAGHQCLVPATVNARSKALVKYSKALQIMKSCLDDPVKARASETLCAVMILMTCQVCQITDLLCWSSKL
jgi:hypothetical protein